VAAVDAKVRRRNVKRRACRKRRKPLKRVPLQPVPPPPAPALAPPPDDPGTPSEGPGASSPLAVWSGPFGVRQAERLLWRAGFGPSPGHAQALAAMGLQRAVASLTRPAGPETFTGAEPTEEDGGPIFPQDARGHDHLWFLDRMVRTNQPLAQRMTLIWHDWFATSGEGVPQQRFMTEQNELFRRHWLGSFHQLVRDVTIDPAMILWLDSHQNRVGRPNENYARELMELFTLGADRGAYTEQDVREMARALTGWRGFRTNELGYHTFAFHPPWFDNSEKTVFGQRGNFNWENAVDMCVRHPMHASFFVNKLWSYFIPVPPSAGDRQALERLYVDSGWQVRPVVEAILLHPQLHGGPRMVKPPVVFVAGMLRALRRSVDDGLWTFLCADAGQRLFWPPDVAGWDDSRWLDTSTVRGRWMVVRKGLDGRELSASAVNNYNPDETPAQGVALARSFWGDPDLTPETVAALERFAARTVAGALTMGQRRQRCGQRQNALRHLLYFSPDLQTS
jgi:uncharacterized protein (DUF1800 family)